MTKKQRLAAAVERLKERYPDALCSLTSRSAFELLVATRLSAQCTDARVNLVTPALFARCPDAEALAETPVEEVEERLKTPVQIIDEPGSDLVKAVVEENQETIHRRRTMYEQADCSNCGPAERG